MDFNTQLRRLVAEAQNEAYARGWRDAMAHAYKILRAAEPPIAPASKPTPSKAPTQEPGDEGAGSVKEVVLNIVRTQPGLRGHEIVAAANALDRTVRTALARLRDAALIHNLDGQWFPGAAPGISQADQASMEKIFE